MSFNFEKGPSVRLVPGILFSVKQLSPSLHISGRDEIHQEVTGKGFIPVEVTVERVIDWSSLGPHTYCLSSEKNIILGL